MTNPSSATSPITATTVEFTYTPKTFLESPITQSRPDYELEVKDGAAKATLSAVQNPVPGALIAAIRSNVESILGARQLLTHRPFKLAAHPHTVQERSDGTRNFSLHVGSGALIVEGHAADYVVKDAAGKIIRDTRAERIAEDKRSIIAMSDAASRNPLVGELLNSFSAAMSDPADEMVHLYEIRDALKKHYGGETAARQKLQITKRQWQELGEIANDRPVDQSRHRGDHISGRRPATASELDVARRAARRLIEAFANVV
jgi:hypothetical protein